jgi:TRAP-type transport system periplasmic protein
MNRRYLAALVLGLGASPIACAQAIWKLATGYRADSFHTRNLDLLAREVGEATSGALRIEIHPDNTFAKLADIAPAVEAGRIEAGETIMSGLVAQIPIAGADSVPFIVRSYGDARRLWRHQRPGIERAFAARGLKALYAVPWPPQCLYSTKPIARIGDLRGLRMRTYNRTTVRIAEMTGATAVDVPMADVARALADGRIDTMITSAVTGVDNKVWYGLKYFYEINAWFPKNIVFVNARVFDALNPAQRQALLKASAAAEARGWAASEAAAAEAVGQLRRNGIKIERASAGVLMEIKTLGERFSLEWVRQVGSEANSIFIPYFTHS